MLQEAKREALQNNRFGISGREACEEIVIGSVAGMAAAIFGYPFDLTKVRLQAQLLQTAEGRPSPTFRGPLHCLDQTWKEEGLRGLYRGISVPLLGAMVNTAGLFFAYATFQNIIWGYQHGNTHSQGRKKPPLTIPQLGVAAAGAGLVASFILTPMELVKCRMQVQMMTIHSQTLRYSSNTSSLATKFFTSHPPLTPPLLHPTTSRSSSHKLTPTRTPFLPLSNIHSVIAQPPGALTILRCILRDHGITGFWLGQTGTIFRETGGCCVWFVMKEVVADSLRKRRHKAQAREDMAKTHFSDYATENSPWESALAGASAGAAATLLFYPADTVKSAIQTGEELRTSSQRTNFIDARPTTFRRAASKVYCAHGLRGFYTGCGVTVARSVPSSGIIFVVYDGLRQWLFSRP